VPYFGKKPTTPSARLAADSIWSVANERPKPTYDIRICVYTAAAILIVIVQWASRVILVTRRRGFKWRLGFR